MAGEREVYGLLPDQETSCLPPPTSTRVRFLVPAGFDPSCVVSGHTQCLPASAPARDAITFSPNRFTAELRCLVWALRSMKDLGYHEVVIGFDFREVTEAVRRPKDWPAFVLYFER
ncbi:hypothetical protein F2Q69_00010459 [Brassica cretica]|uniref:RNase H type-1 domain-containing protein n=1 Tax=Brassica cretica TaxID=69181 RepID=A0A8S9R023_BRACR|nr:hypothetical protein F2Q69_00010459 [Brassica cretica]